MLERVAGRGTGACRDAADVHHEEKVRAEPENVHHGLADGGAERP